MASKSRLEMIEQCTQMDPTGNNQAVQRHKTKLVAMTDEEYMAHRERLNAKEPAMRRTAARMANEFRWSFVKIP
jgi:hypothetical protein